jgi:hypothetical protein
MNTDTQTPAADIPAELNRLAETLVTAYTNLKVVARRTARTGSPEMQAAREEYMATEKTFWSFVNANGIAYSTAARLIL